MVQLRVAGQQSLNIQNTAAAEANMRERKASQ